MSRDDRKRAIGKIVSVAADRFVVEMHSGTDNFTVVGFDDVHYVARLGSFLMVPVQDEYVVVEVVGLRERDSGNPGHGSGDMDKAASAKYLDVVPVGMLPQVRGAKFRFGVSIYPSLYADALYALDAELDRVFETEVVTEQPPDPGGQALPTRYNALSIGRSVVFEGYDVKVKIDEFFGAHTAVLGNTGSGKSCTISSVLQSLFQKPDEHRARGATFIVFDVNGEYWQSLSPLAADEGIGVSRLVLDGSAEPGRFRLPHWFLDQTEWELLLQASERTQMPVLRTALGLTGLFRKDSPEALLVKEHFMARCIIECFRGADGDSPVSKFHRVVSLLQRYPTKDLNLALLRAYGANFQFGNFANNNLVPFLEKVGEKVREEIKLPSYDRTPFAFDDLEECLDFAILYEESHGNRQIRDYCSQMVTRLKSLKERSDFRFLRHELPTEGDAPTTGTFLKTLLGLREAGPGGKLIKDAQIVVVDMNDVEDEVVELVSSVLARMTFRLLRQADPRNRFPVHLLLEEAHRYISETPSRFAIDAHRIYERIAKEGRKYGLFLLVASQRPSELSKTVLSQCSNFVVHRIQNPDDLSQIRQMTPFISDAVLKRLPSLPKQHALVFGTSVNLPTTFRVRNADPLPKSDDAKIRDLWFHGADRAAGISFSQSSAPPGLLESEAC
ncbi:protein of unknown function DUF87 [Rhizobium leguminosarum bv. trifolii WSM1325]|uniref:Helicase HerA central domain-containing protein n=1 Tax=Rhizobium leguminosarum bv. trifolii (strain WSM1325) TaxID=395491 RepID=C6B095_RHILS|nr:ATP-binding protein [Rhizobium leguminosarum]ACS54514.1 protein of unknown function DUF87 [Rhizobium leguminosarum bv. trifolii WSM1325]